MSVIICYRAVEAGHIAEGVVAGPGWDLRRLVAPTGTIAWSFAVQLGISNIFAELRDPAAAAGAAAESRPNSLRPARVAGEGGEGGRAEIVQLLGGEGQAAGAVRAVGAGAMVATARGKPAAAISAEDERRIAAMDWVITWQVWPCFQLGRPVQRLFRSHGGERQGVAVAEGWRGEGGGGGGGIEDSVFLT